LGWGADFSRFASDTECARAGRFADEARLDGPYFYCKQSQVMRAARALARVADLSLHVRCLLRGPLPCPCQLARACC